MLSCEMLIFQSTFISSRERSFHSEYVSYLDLLPHGYSSCGFLGLVLGEPAVLKAEVITDFTQDEGEHSGRVRLLWVVIPIHEDVLSTRMPMEVTVESDFPLFGEGFDHAFNGMDDWVQDFGRRFPTSVEIRAA